MFNSITSSFKSVLSDMEKDYNAIHNPKNKKNLFSYFLSHFNMFTNSNSTKKSTTNNGTNGTTSHSEMKLLMKHYNSEVEKMSIHVELKETQRQLEALQKKYEEVVKENSKLNEVNKYQHTQLQKLANKFAKSFDSNSPSKTPQPKPQPKQNATPKKFESGKFIFDMKFFSKN